MARSSTPTLLPLDRFAKLLGVNPLHFNGITIPDLAPASVCGQPIMQYAYQTADGLSREDIAQAISDAEERITQYLGFKPLPQFEIDERHNYLRSAQPELMAWRLAAPNGLGVAVQLNYGHLIAGGVRAVSSIAFNAPVVYSDADGDNYKETATIAVATTVTDPNEIVAFYPGTTDPEWEIRPIQVSISGGLATLTIRREQLVNPTLLEPFGARSLDGTSDPNFLSTIDVARQWHDPSQQVQFLWENSLFACGCQTDTCQTCWLAAQFGCTLARDYRLGLISTQAAGWNSVTGQYEFAPYSVNRAPDRARFWYRAGYRDNRRRRPMHEMDPKWERAIAYLAVTLLERPMCACQPVESFSRYWREDLAQTTSSSGGDVTTYRTTTKLLDNPLGTTRGAVHAWRIIRNEALGEAAFVQ